MFHLELVLVAGFLQTSLTDGRETLQSRPLLLQHRGEEVGREVLGNYASLCMFEDRFTGKYTFSESQESFIQIKSNK